MRTGERRKVCYVFLKQMPRFRTLAFLPCVCSTALLQILEPENWNVPSEDVKGFSRRVLNGTYESEFPINGAASLTNVRSFV